jgi:F0F1-type ATP synthase assembly protein I
VTDRQHEKERQPRRPGAVYQGVTEAAIAVPVAGGIGYWIDSTYGTEPTFLLIGFGLGFIAFTIRLVRLGCSMKHEDSGASSETDKSVNESER